MRTRNPTTRTQFWRAIRSKQLATLCVTHRLLHSTKTMIGNVDEREGAICMTKVESREQLLTLDQRNSSSDLFISISGLIGAGKSTLATKLAEKMQLPCFYEPVIDNAYLADFYKDPARYSFPLQVRKIF